MNRRNVLGMTIVLGLSGAVMADTIPSFTISDGSVTYTERGLMGGGPGAGSGDYIVGGTDHMFQNWWWFSQQPDMRFERALGRQIHGAVTAPNSANLVYDEMSGNRFLRYELEYTVTDLLPGSDKPDIGLVQIAFSVVNRSNEPTLLKFYNYADFDLAGTFGDDSATINGISSQFQHITDPGDAQRNPTEAFYIASSTALSHWEIDDFPLIRDKLENDEKNDLADARSPFGPGDYTGAFQWTVELAPFGDPHGGDTLVGSIVKKIHVIPEPTSLLLLGLGAVLFGRRRA